MYYDLIASLPHLPHFERAQRLPITPRRLEQRLRRLRDQHAEQLDRAKRLASWRLRQTMGHTDAALVAVYWKLMQSHLDSDLRDYVAFRATQHTLLAALRRRRDGLGLPADSNSWGFGPRLHHIRRHWETPYFGLEHVYPWLPRAGERLSSSNALGLERLLMDLNWGWLTRCAEQSMFGFPAVMAYVFKWEMLQAWIGCDATVARIRFTELVDKVTHVENA